MREISIYDEIIGDKERRSLKVRIKDSDELVMEDYDCGNSVKGYWGDFDHEFRLTVKNENVPFLLLLLIKERFKSSSNFKSWLD